MERMEKGMTVIWDKIKTPFGFIEKASFNQKIYYETIINIVKSTSIFLPSVLVIG